MIKKIVMKNFQSHEDTTIQFCDKLNLIVGMSNSGKSSIIRALSCCVANRWQKEQVRTGCTHCQVQVHTQKGYVRCQRGQGINRWIVFDGKQQKEYKSIGTTVPQEVPIILGMGQRNRGQIKQMPNFMFQLQKHYMLSEIDGKKATSNLIARMMDNAIGLGGMEDLIKNIATDLTKDKRKLTELTSTISQKKAKIIDDKIFSGYQKLINDCNVKKEKVLELTQMLQKTQKIHEEYKDKKRQIEDLTTKVIQLDVEDVLFSLREIQEKYILIDTYKKLIDSKNKIFDIDLSQFLVELNEIEEIYKKYSEAKVALKQYQSKQKRLSLLNIELKRNQIQFQKAHDRFQQLKKELGYCPICERKFE